MGFPPLADLHTSRVATVIPCNRDQTLLLLPGDLAHVVVAAVACLPLTSFPVNPQAGGKPQYHPRRNVRATHRDIGLRFVAAKLHPDHNTIAVFRRANKVAFDAKKGRRGRPPKPPDAAPPPERQSNLTDPDCALMRRSDAREYRQTYSAQAVVCACGSQLILAAKPVACASDAPGFAATILAMAKTIGLPAAVPADTG